MTAVEAIAALVRDGLVQAVVLALPLAGAALVAALATGLLAGRLGLQDPALGLVARAVAVVVALVLVAGSLAERTRELATDAWARLPALGRGEAGSP